ncbi:hypothetical protein MLD38_012286 [Melastoma candidum]|uniref:Uncharacterized protein n=1 Tax=Melastoma candidum TaxID=119954 RepID=A0ACB9R5X0_9MYRT|nr:hypothetical protein MLD38_012286 [Melastoma candidum]
MITPLKHYATFSQSSHILSVDVLSSLYRDKESSKITISCKMHNATEIKLHKDQPGFCDPEQILNQTSGQPSEAVALAPPKKTNPPFSSHFGTRRKQPTKE